MNMQHFNTIETVVTHTVLFKFIFNMTRFTSPISYTVVFKMLLSRFWGNHINQKATYQNH